MEGNWVKNVSGGYVAEIQGDWIRMINGGYQYKIEGSLSQSEKLALVAILFGGR